MSWRVEKVTVYRFYLENLAERETPWKEIKPY